MSARLSTIRMSVYREGLAHILAAESTDMRDRDDDANDWPAALRWLQRHVPDVVCVDTVSASTVVHGSCDRNRERSR